MGLKDVLLKHNIPLPPDFDERMDIVVSGLKRSPGYKQKLEAFKSQKGGEDPVSLINSIPINVKPVREDWLGPTLRWFLNVSTSPFSRNLLEALFMVIFCLSYLESIPIFGSILSAGLDLYLAGGKMLVKTIQSALPPMVGLIPLPYASLVGIMMAAVFGYIVWPVIAIVSLSRQDFSSAIESFIRVIPPPFGDMLANVFLEGNRTIARMDEKRKKVAEDISNAMELISSTMTDVSSSMKDNFKSLAAQTRAAATLPTRPAMTAGDLHRRGGKSNKKKRWQTRRTRRRSARH
jgi:hypothetical protein